MHMFDSLVHSIQLGGAVMYPLMILAFIALAITVDKFLLYCHVVKFPKTLVQMMDAEDFSWEKFDETLSTISNKNGTKKFFATIAVHKNKPVWFIEEKAQDEAKLIEKSLQGGLWVLETIVTVAPLLGLLGTIMGMMSSFKLIGEDSLINPTGVTAGVAEALIVTAFGLAIAIVSLMIFNYFSRKTDAILDDLERFGSQLIRYVRFENEDQ